MISEELVNFSKIFHEDILTESEVLGDSVDLVFANQMGYLLEEYGETDTVTNCEFQEHGMRVDGFCYDDEWNLTILLPYSKK